MSETEPTDPVASAPAETAPLPEPTSPPPRAPVAEPPPPRRRGGRAFRVIGTLLFLLLAAAVGWLWNQQQMLAQQLAAQHLPADQSAQVADLQQKLDGLQQQLTALQNRPSPPPAPAAAPAAAPVDLKPLEDRLAALEQRGTQAPPPPPPPPPPVDLGPLTQKLDAVAAEAAAAKGAEADLNSRLAEVTQRLATAEQQASQFGSKAAQAQRIEQAQVALESGSPLGTIPNAPPAVTRFAETAPPTEASLRLSFPAAAAAAERASSPSVAGKSLGERMWLRARSLVTVKQGDEVLVGAPAAKVLGVAQMRLEAGDLAGAVKALDGLDGPAAQAMAPWRQQAQALLDARAALSRMAGA